MAKVQNRNNRTRGVTVPVGYTYERVQAADEDSQDKSQEMDSHTQKQSYGNEKTVRSQNSIAAWMNTNMNMNDIVYKTNTNTSTRTRWSHQCQQCQCQRQFHCKVIYITSCFILFAIMMKTYGNRNWYVQQYYGHDNGQSSSSRIYNFNVRYSGMTNGNSNDNGISFSRPHNNNNDDHNGNGDGNGNVNDSDDGDTNLFAEALERAIMDSFANTSLSSISKLYDHYYIDIDIDNTDDVHDREEDDRNANITVMESEKEEGESGTSSSDTSRSSESVPVSSVPVPISKSILHDLNTPQGKAFHWIVHQDTYTHNLQRKFKFRFKSKMEMKNTMEMDMGTDMDIDMEQQSHPQSYSYHLYDENKIVQRYILLVFFFQTGGEYNVNFAKRFTPQSNVLVNWAVFPYGDVGFFSGSGNGSGRRGRGRRGRGLGNKRKRNSTRGIGHGDECNWNINIYDSRGSAKGHRYRHRKRHLTQKRTRTRTKYGVTCDANDRVVEMNFNGMGLGRGGPRSSLSSLSLSSSSGSGSSITTHNYSYSSIPAELGLLSHLKRLDLRDNHLTGTIPDSIGGFVVAKMKIGGDVDGHGNGHEDVVHGDVVDGNGDGNVWNGALEYLDVSGNKLVGPVPESLGSLVHLNLQSIFLHSNRIHGGSIPPSLCEVPAVFGKNLSNEHDHEHEHYDDDLSTKTSNGGDDDDDDDDDDGNMANFQVKASSSSSRRELWADCAQEFDPVQCKCCTYCCDIMSLEEEEEGCVWNMIS